jgi:glycosyltransferase involved in cell wall biosynthesis
MKISIITPSFNQDKYLEQTILSVKNQNYANVEHIIIDGNSSDKSVEIIKKYEKDLFYWVSEKDNGQSSAINKGLKKCTGEIIMWLNSDDILLEGVLKKAAAIFSENPNVIMLHGKSILFGNNQKEKIIGKRQKDFKIKYLAYIPFPQPSSFFRKKLIEETGYLDETLHYGMDYELLARAALSYDVLFVNEIFSKYRLHPKSKTNDTLKFCSDWNLVFSSVLNSLGAKEELKKELKELGFYKKTTKIYKVSNKYSQKNIELAVLHHLLIMMHFNYNELNLTKAKEIASSIKKISPNFYKQKKVGVINFRATVLNKYLLTLMRKLTRK